MRFKTNYQKKILQRNARLSFKYQELVKEVAPTRAISILANSYKMTIPGIRWILAKEGLLKIKYSKNRVLTLANTLCKEDNENNLYCLYSILINMPDKANIDEIEDIVVSDLDTTCSNGNQSRWTNHGDGIYGDFIRLKELLLK